MPVEIQELIQSLTHTTAQLARLQGGEPCQVERALAERMRAIEGIWEWIREQPEAARAMGRELARQLQRDLDKGTQILLQFAMAREVMRNDRMTLLRQLQLLHGIQALRVPRGKSISCRG